MERIKARTPPTHIEDTIILPLQLLGLPSFLKQPTHYIYVRPNKVTSPTSARSLYISNIPIDATQAHFRSVFANYLGGVRIAAVEFEEARSTSNESRSGATAPGARSRKRKRGIVAEADEGGAKGGAELPSTWDREILRSGSSAVVVFADRMSMEVAMRAVKRTARKGTTIVWGANVEDQNLAFGSQRYFRHQQLSFPSHSLLQDAVDQYMTDFSEAEQSRAQKLARQRTATDDEGFMTVSRGGRVGPARREEAEDALTKQKTKDAKRSEDLNAFYRFQTRERKKEQAKELVRKFNADTKLVQGLRSEKHDVFVP